MLTAVSIKNEGAGKGLKAACTIVLVSQMKTAKPSTGVVGFLQGDRGTAQEDSRAPLSYMSLKLALCFIKDDVFKVEATSGLCLS